FHSRQGDTIFFFFFPFAYRANPMDCYSLTWKARFHVALKSGKTFELLNHKLIPVIYKRHYGLVRVEEVLEKEIHEMYDEVFFSDLEEVFLNRKVPFQKKDGRIYNGLPHNNGQ
ncbi:MAG: hypothetical protein AB8F95_05405, partial [Bacteroidia bacterium]